MRIASEQQEIQTSSPKLEFDLDAESLRLWPKSELGLWPYQRESQDLSAQLSLAYSLSYATLLAISKGAAAF